MGCLGCEDMCIQKNSFYGSCSLRTGSFLTIIYAIVMGVVEITLTLFQFGLGYKHTDNLWKKGTFIVFIMGGTLLIVGAIELLIGVLRQNVFLIDVSRLVLTLFFFIFSFFILYMMILQFNKSNNLYGILGIILLFGELCFHKYMLLLILSYQKQVEANDEAQLEEDEMMKDSPNLTYKEIDLSKDNRVISQNQIKLEKRDSLDPSPKVLMEKGDLQKKDEDLMKKIVSRKQIYLVNSPNKEASQKQSHTDLNSSKRISIDSQTKDELNSKQKSKDRVKKVKIEGSSSKNNVDSPKPEVVNSAKRKTDSVNEDIIDDQD